MRKRRRQSIRGTTITIYFRPEVEQFIRERAAEEGTSIALIVNEAIMQYRDWMRTCQEHETVEHDHVSA